MKNEATLIKRIKRKGDKEAANELISFYYKEIYRFLYKQTLQKELAMDLTQEVFISVLQSIHTFDQRKASFRTWLYRLATNRIIDYYRSIYYKYHQLIVPMEEESLNGEEDFTIRLEQQQDLEKVVAVVNQLDAGSQEIFRLKLFAEYTFRDIAEVLDLPESTVKTKFYTAQKYVKQVWKEGAHEA